MAKIGLFTFPGMGHVNPMATLGRRLQGLGHTVVFYQVPDMEAPIRAAGLDYVPIGAAEFPPGSLRRLDAEVAKLGGLKALKFLIGRQTASSRMLLDTLPDLLRSARLDLMLVDAVDPATGTVAEHLRVPWMTVDLIPPIFDEASAPPWCFGWRYREGSLARLRNFVGNKVFLGLGRSLLTSIAPARKRWGLPPHRAMTDAFSARTRVAQIPRFLDFPRRSLPANFHYTGPFTDASARAPVAFPWERLDGRPLLYASLGTLQNGVAAVFRAIAEAVAELEVQLVLAVGATLTRADLEPLAGEPIVVTHAPQIELIERSALVITHAGMNTALEALQHGKPMVAIPIASDQPGIAARLARLGVAEVVPFGKVSAARLRQAVQRVLGEPAYSARAAARQAELARLQGLDRAAQLVDEELRALAGAEKTLPSTWEV